MALPKIPPAFLIKLVSPVYLQERAMLIEAKNSRRSVIEIRRSPLQMFQVNGNRGKLETARRIDEGPPSPRKPGYSAATAPMTALTSKYSSKPNGPHSRPLPDCL